MQEYVPEAAHVVDGLLGSDATYLALTAERMAGRRHRIASVIVQRIDTHPEGGDEGSSERTTVEPEREGVS